MCVAPVDARLVSVDDRGVRLAHDALLTARPRLRGWVEEYQQDLLLRQRLDEAANNWREQRPRPRRPLPGDAWPPTPSGRAWWSASRRAFKASPLVARATTSSELRARRLLTAPGSDQSPGPPSGPGASYVSSLAADCYGRREMITRISARTTPVAASRCTGSSSLIELSRSR
ncbi:nSTAND1 domain-containing NTPase [Streptomyces rochei]|uniref:nSTAND1 domain-containing NTPase n=1 Tax=Streptomyces rochei TaxID=1928 RepID=UPI003F4AFF42